jgi:hypothetical protein
MFPRWLLVTAFLATILKKRNINFLTTNEDRRVRKHLDAIRVKLAKSQRQT